MDFSSSARIPANQRPNRFSRILESRRRDGAKLLDLSESNPTRAGLGCDGDAILNALADPRSLTYEPSPKGLLAAREAVADYYAGRGCQVQPDEILLTSSTSEAYSWIFKLLSGAGGEILVPRPSYPLFDHLASLECLVARPYPLYYDDGWWVDLDAVQRSIGPRTRAMVIVNPNNPTGSYVKREELASVEKLCASGGLALISDEVFWDYPLAPHPSSVMTLLEGIHTTRFCLGGLSKSLGLPQMKLGWIVTRGPQPECARAMEGLDWIADTFLPVSAPVQHAASRLLQGAGHFQNRLRARLRANLEECLRLAAAPGCAWAPLRVEGGWYAVLRLPRLLGDEQWAIRFLESDNVVVQPGYFYDFESEAYVVVSLLPEPARFREGLRRLAATIARIVEKGVDHE